MQEDSKNENNKLKETLWNLEQDAYLKDFIKPHETTNRVMITEPLNNKIPSCPISDKRKNIWRGELEIPSKRHPWSDEDRLALLVAHKKHRNKWSVISGNMIKRSSNKIKNRFYSLFRKVINRIKRSDFLFESSLDVIETCYVVSLIESYLKERESLNLLEAQKDYAFRLIEDLDITAVIEYKDRFSKIKKEGTIELMLEKLSEKHGTTLLEHKEKSVSNFLQSNKEVQPMSFPEKPRKILKLELTLPSPRSFYPAEGISWEEKRNNLENGFP